MGVLSITLFGSLTASLDGRAIDQFEYNKVRALLAYLVTESASPHPRDALAGLLWPDQSQTAALNSLRNALSTLRQAIGDRQASPPYLFITRDTIQFNPLSDHWLDVSRMTQLLAANHLHRHRRIECCWGCADRLAEAVNLYRGEFLHNFHLADSDLFEDWAALKREHLAKMALQALQQLAAIYEWRGEHSNALSFVQRQLELDPYYEAAHQQAMKLLATLSRRAEACAHYEHFRASLAAEIGVEPTSETIHLYEQIKYGVFQGAPTTQPLKHNNLPTYLTSFVGRKEELDDIAALLQDPACRMLTLLGPGGVGKTRLAVAAATEQSLAFANGVCFVRLAGTTSVQFIIPAILHALGLKQSDQGDLMDQLAAYLADKELLLILDNFEQLIEGATQVRELLLRCPALVAMVTSRRCLDLQFEWLFEVNGLSFPAEISSVGLGEYDAIQLFTQRLHQVKPRKSFSVADLSAIARICQLVDGLPLGIELAVASARQQPVEQVAYAIQASAASLSSSWRDVPEEHRSLQAVFAHSWSLLSDAEQNVFQGLSVFSGGFTEDAAQQITGASPQILVSLVKHSLVRYYPDRQRYILLEILRQFGLQKLSDSGIALTVHERHLQFYLNLAEVCYATYHQKLEWKDLSRLIPEVENVRAALEECLSTNQPDLALQIAGAMGDFWLHFGYGLEADAWLSRILDCGVNFNRDHYLARALLIAGFITKNKDMQAGKRLQEQALAIWQGVDDDENVAIALLNLYYYPLLQGEYDQAIAMLEQALAIFQRLDNQIRLAATMDDLCDTYMIYDYQKYLDKARSLAELALAIDQRIGRTSAIHWDLKLIGHIEMHVGNYQKARKLFEQAIAQITDTENAIELSDVYRALGIACYHLGDYVSARKYFELRLSTTNKSYFGYQDIATLCEYSYLLSRLGEHDNALFHFKEVFRQIDGGGDTCLAIIKGSLEKVPGVLLACGELERAARLFGFTDGLREKQKLILASYRRLDFDRDVAEIRHLLGEAVFNALWDAGRGMSFEQARIVALEARVRAGEKSTNEILL